MFDVLLRFPSQSTPESWAQNSHDNIVNGQNQLMASIQLRALIDSILSDISRDMREQADVVETEFARRISEMSDALQKMIQNMREVIDLERKHVSLALFMFFRHSKVSLKMKGKLICFVHQYGRKKLLLK